MTRHSRRAPLGNQSRRQCPASASVQHPRRPAQRGRGPGRDPHRQRHPRLDRRSGRRLDIAGIIQDHDYFRDEVEPHLDGESVRYLGPVDAADRSETLGAAHALLHLIDFDEPFGYSVAEALACGTPVIAYDRGSMAELIVDGTSGFLVADVAGATASVERCSQLDRAVIRADAATRFGLRTMVDRYVEVYRRVLAGTAG